VKIHQVLFWGFQRAKLHIRPEIVKPTHWDVTQERSGRSFWMMRLRPLKAGEKPKRLKLKEDDIRTDDAVE
jgi:hypothetical protein